MMQRIKFHKCKWGRISPFKCFWNIKKKVLSNIERDFETKQEFTVFIDYWKKVVYSKTENEYIEPFCELKKNYDQIQTKVEAY